MSNDIPYDTLTKILEESILELIGGEEEFDKLTDNLISKHRKKIHFIPLKYRVLGGFLQSLNIKFGNFIETFIPKLITVMETNLIVIEEYSNRKDIRLSLEQECERKIDNYINHPPQSIDKSFEDLLDYIFTLQNKRDGVFKTETYDVDLLLKDETRYYYIEVKYNDDHDTGKFKDINRKFIKTFAGLVNKLHITDKNEITPILYYFNESVRYRDIYLKEDKYVLRGRKLFEKLNLSISYKDIEEVLLKMSKTLEDKFDKFKDKIFDKVHNNKK